MMKKIWVLIYVYRGLIQEPEIFYDKDSAVKRESVLLSEMNPDYDEVGVFEKEIG
jgi:hypothetical protein